MEKLLRSWNVNQDIINKFIEEEIGLPELQSLKEADYGHFFPKLGPKVIFRARLEEWQKTVSARSDDLFKESYPYGLNDYFIKDRVRPPSSKPFRPQFEQNDTLKRYRAPSPVSPEKHPRTGSPPNRYEPYPSVDYRDHSSFQNSSQVYPEDSYSQDEAEGYFRTSPPQKRVDHTAGFSQSQNRSEEQSTASKNAPQIGAESPVHRPENHYTVVSHAKSVETTHTLKQCLKNIDDLKKLIEDYLAGKDKLLHFQSMKKLSNESRVAKIVISHELQCFPRQKLSADRLLFLRELCCEMFPHTELEFWYAPHRSQSDGQRVNARGKLQDQYLRLRKHLLRNGLTERIKSESKDTTNQNKDKTAEVNNEVSSTVVVDERLNETNRPFSEIAAAWHETYKMRKNNWEIQYDNVDEYYAHFPILREHFGLDLLLSDFQQAYPSKVDNLLSNWPRFKEILLGYGQKKTITDKRFLQYVAHAGINLREARDNESTVNALKLLAILLPCCKTIKGRNKEWKPERKDLIEGMFLQASTPAELEDHLEAKKKHYQELGLSFPPLPVFIVNYGTVFDSYVAICNSTYKVDSPIHALDACFKSYQVMDARYPPEAKLAWTFIQKVMYDIKLTSEKYYVSLGNLEKDLKHFEDQPNK